MSIYPETDLVILAGGQARRMQGKNKLLQCFDQDTQLQKIYREFQNQVSKVWVNSSQDCAIYQKIVPDVECFADDQSGFLGPLMGMKSAWTHVKADYVLFIPCDITFIPSDVLTKMHQALQDIENAQAVFVSINAQNLYPFCLLKKESLPVLEKHLENNQLSIRKCLDELNAQVINCQHSFSFHSINSEQELAQYRKELQQLDRYKSNS